MCNVTFMGAVDAAIKPRGRLQFPSLQYFKQEVFNKSFSKWRKSLYQLSLINVLNVFWKKWNK